MLGSFRFRMFIVLIIAIFTSISLKAGHESKAVVEPVLRYILRDYGFESKIAAFLENYQEEHEEVPVMSKGIRWQKPCEFLYVIQKYGWYWNEKEKRQEFSPGIRIKVKNNSLIKPITEGVVEEIGSDKKGRYVLIKHDESFFSLYGGLKEILVTEKSKVDKETILGKSTDVLYMELRDQEGPINSNSIVE
ncbi:M23 family metallopeptidase [Thermosyntropha sp.]|uniref:M23 family metallopeptidase n=1 Tax=Thermosyntropha sp. TaxID=2740820 RepID=UPI0025F27099|nr:M23 family metallopeptidase [Thermosyntropha sp.]MBO8158778.1 M23 family metallopeptidase [Thermosyntropha sp.]